MTNKVITEKEWNDEFRKSYKKYRNKNDSIINNRIRPDKQNFFDALMSIDIKNDPDGKTGIEIIKAL
jgi:Zn-finger domain-containing protein